MSTMVPDPAQTEWVPLWDTGAVARPGFGSSIPGEIKMWSGTALPNAVRYGKWVWADGAVYSETTYPEAAGNIASAWKTAHGQADPGAGNFRAPDLRGVNAMGLDAMPGGTRANRTTRSIAITLCGRTGEEYHTISVAEMPAHAHTVNSHSHAVNTGYISNDHTHTTGGQSANHQHYFGREVVSLAPGGNAYSITGNQATQDAITGYFTADHTHGTYGVSANHYHGVNAEAPGTNNIGSGGAHETLPPTIFVPWIVRLDG